MIHYYTSLTSNYLPKARVLARSAKKHAPAAVFHLVLNDEPPPGFDPAKEPFDEVLTPRHLGIPDLDSWLFRHDLVETCTAVKGAVLWRLLNLPGSEKVFYFDPDIAILGDPSGLHAMLDEHAILLTPHQSAPQATDDAVRDIEFICLLYGVFNLGFVGVSRSEQGLAFAKWWRDRLLSFCYEETEKGLYTDQRWCDLAPCYFDGLRILKEPQFNVSHWNLAQRTVTGSAESGLLVDGVPLVFYHFSGFERGRHRRMLEQRSGGSPGLFQLEEWYGDQLDRNGQGELGGRPWAFDLYSNGERITRPQRILYRAREELWSRFPRPADAGAPGGSYLDWYRANSPGRLSPDLERTDLGAADYVRMIEAIRASWSWRIGQAATAPVRAVRRILGRGKA